MTKLTLLFFLAFAGFITGAQNKQSQPQYSKSELKIKALLDKSDAHYQNSNKVDYPYARDSAFYYANKAEALSKKLNSPLFLGKTYVIHAAIVDSYAEYRMNEKDYRKSVDYLQKAIAIFKKLNNDEELCSAYRLLLLIQANEVPIEQTIALGEKALTLSRKIKDKELEGQLLQDLAYYYSLQNNFDKSISLLHETLKVYKSAKIDNVQTIYGHLGALYNELGEFEKALQYCLKAIVLAEKYKTEDYDTVELYNFTGIIYRGFKNYKESLKYFEKAVAFAKKINNRGVQVYYEANTAEVALLAGNKDKALYYLNEIEKKDDLAYDPQFVNSLTVLTTSHVKLKNEAKADKYAQIILKTYDNYKATAEEKAVTTGFSAALMSYFYYKKKYDLCKKYTLIYKDRAVESKSKQKIMNAYQMLFKIDSAQANHKSALDNYKMEMLYKDSIFDEAKNKQFTEMQVKYESEEKEKSNLLLKKQAELQKSKLSKADLMKNVGLAGIAILIITVIILYRRYVLNKRIRKVISQKNETLQNTIQEKEWLLKEIHHRVKNNLQVVMSLLNTQSHYLQDESAKKAIKNSQNRIHSMSLIHKKLYQSNNIVSVDMNLYIRELIEYLKESLDTGKRIDFEIDAEPIELSSAQSVPLSLILNETIMNSIKHAFPDRQEGIISITLITLPENLIRLTIKDNGIGYKGDFTDLKNASTLGMKLIQGFSNELNATLRFDDNHPGLIIILEFVNNTTRK